MGSIGPDYTRGFVLVFSPLPYLMLVVAAPTTSHRPCATTRLTSFGASVISVSSKLVSLVRPLGVAPSGAVGNRLLTRDRTKPHVSVSLTPRTRIPVLRLGPTAIPFDVSGAFMLY